MEKKKNVHDEITRIAHDLYEKRGRIHGHDLEDWLEAERSVLGRYSKGIEGREKKTSKQWKKGPHKKIR